MMHNNSCLRIFTLYILRCSHQLIFEFKFLLNERLRIKVGEKEEEEDENGNDKNNVDSK